MNTETSTAQTATQTASDKTQTEMAILRDRFPLLRRSGPVAIVHNGGRATVLGCLCGATHSTPTSTRAKALHVKAFIAEHRDCAAELAARIEGLTLTRRNTRHGNVVASNVVLVEV